jgi:hypothetical protein
MSPGLRIGFGGIALVAAVLALGGCGGGDGAPGATDLRKTEDRPGHEPAAVRQPPARRTVLAHRLGPARIEPGTQMLPARPCSEIGTNGTATVHAFSDAPPCVRVAPGERLRFVNDTGLGPRHEGATAVRILVGDYELSIGPHGSGLVPAPVETYLGRGAHRVRMTGARGATVLLLPRVCAIRPPAAPGEELCFRRR